MNGLVNGLVGLRFRPTEEEIITYYLELKMSGQQFPFPAVNEVDIRNYNPWELPQESILPDDQVWYFFCVPSKKYANSNRANRTTSEGTGSWKITAKDREVKEKRTGKAVGIRKSLTFYQGRNTCTVRTRWAMHEYHSNNASSYQKEFVFCRLKFKFHDKSAASPGEVWPLNALNIEAQNIGAPVNSEPPLEIDLVDESDFPILQSFLHPEQSSSPSNGSNNEVNLWSSQFEDMNEQDDDFANSLFLSDNDQFYEETTHNDVNLWSSQFEDMNEQDDVFVNSLFLSDDNQFYEKTTHSRPHALNPTKPVSGVYLGDSSDSDTETLRRQYVDADLKEYLLMQRVRAPTETPPSVNLHRCKKGESVLFHDEMSVSTAKSRTDMAKRINLVHSAAPTTIRASKAQAPKILKLDEKDSRTATAAHGDRAREVKEPAINLPQKGNPAVKLQKEQKTAKTTKGKPNSKSGSTTSDGGITKGVFKFVETSPVKCEQIPPSIYIRNVVVGVVLLAFLYYEMVSLH